MFVLPFLTSSGGRVSPDTKEPAKSKVESAVSAAATDDVLMTEVVGSTESYRRLGEVLVSALAALPGATLLTSLIRAPGDTGLDETKLVVGVICAAVAVGVGVTLAMWLRAPVSVTVQELKKQDFTQLVLTSQDNYEELLQRIEEAGADIRDAKNEPERAKAQAQMSALLATLRRVQLVATANKLRERVLNWKTITLALAALAFAAAAVALLALAPKPKAADAAAATVVDVQLTSDGQRLLGCPTSKFQALKVGGEDEAPQVVPLNVRCEAGALLKLTVAEKEGTAMKVSAAEPVAPTKATNPSSTTTTASPSSTTTTISPTP